MARSADQLLDRLAYTTEGQIVVGLLELAAVGVLLFRLARRISPTPRSSKE